MKGKMTISVDGKNLGIEGNMGFHSEVEKYILVISIAKAMKITTLDQWAKMSTMAVLGVGEADTYTSAEIRIPRRKENNNETDAL